MLWLGVKPARSMRASEPVLEFLRRGFVDTAAGAADQEDNAFAGGVVVCAGNEGVAARDAMDEPLLHEEIEGAVDRDGSDPFAGCAEPFGDVVGALRPAGLGDGLQDLAAQGRELEAARTTEGFRPREHVTGTTLARVVTVVTVHGCSNGMIRRLSRGFVTVYHRRPGLHQ